MNYKTPKISKKIIKSKAPKKTTKSRRIIYDGMKNSEPDLYAQYKRNKDSEYVFNDRYINLKINHELREYILNYILNLCFEFEYELYTYFLCIALYDKFLLKEYSISKDIFEKDITESIKNYLKFICLTCLVIAAKFNEHSQQSLAEYSKYSEYSIDNIIHQEGKILKTLDWVVELPTSYYFFEYYNSNKRLVLCSGNVINVTKYILINLSMDANSLKYKPSLLALCALLVADEKINTETHDLLELWKHILIEFTGYNSDEIKVCKDFILNSIL